MHLFLFIFYSMLYEVDSNEYRKNNWQKKLIIMAKKFK